MLVTTTTTTCMAMGASQAAVYGAIAVGILIVLLIAKELLTSYEYKSAEHSNIMEPHPKAKSLASNINAVIYPLLFTFASIVFVKVIEIL
ncbi:MAG: hypothetical protein CHKLHMKO_00486 [Candidatus Argoarchaeum ethanivorans]|uniref:Uncharacterized protein n=1 Tax=Candidatus Argoarchaeum ethanivorans TaxID=2608793 RepID=A0A811T858_9EURY|nr:MAG: hypothetical protein CHKLHMKO_00486 [Candidatus Argoarchaeum ethanivorans]